MELLYLYIVNDRITIRNEGFNFSNQFFFNYEKSGELSGKLKITENPNYIEDFFGKTPDLITTEKVTRLSGGIVNVTGIIGENGSGKINLLTFLTKLFTDSLPLGEEFIVAFKNLSSHSVTIYYTLKGSQINTEDSIGDWLIERPVKQKVTHVKDFGNFYKVPAKLVENVGAIYYSPIFDLRNFPSNVSNEYKNFIDVSTNALIENDVWHFGDSNPEDVGKLELYRSSNVRRQFAMILNSGLAGLNGMNFPKEVNFAFYRDLFDPKATKRNISSENLQIFEELDSEINNEFSRVNGVMHRLERQQDEKVRRSSSAYVNDPEYIQALKDKLKIEFTYAFIHNYFRNLNSEYEDIIGIDKVQGHGLFDKASYFFNNQQWRGKKNTGIVKAGNLYNVVIKLIQNVDFKKRRIEDNANSFYVDITGAIEILSSYEAYIDSVPSDYTRNFISTNWRNLSSGESALLDLYSRLYFAKVNRLDIEKAETGKTIEFLYILIDEGEAGFHPQWQSEYLERLLRFIKLLFIDYQIQLIITSHSPFLVSDLPKENLIFIEKIDGYCKVVPFNEDQTFAANIHTLFAHQFFMKNGVIGLFAQNKLKQELSDLLDDKPKDIDEARLRKFIATIGEPVLQKKLTDILNNKK
jgi:predicted ATPase